MIYIGHGNSLHKSVWQVAKRSSTASLFIKNIARSIWGSSKLSNRCLSVCDTLKKISTRESPRKIVTPEKLKALRRK